GVAETIPSPTGERFSRLVHGAAGASFALVGSADGQGSEWAMDPVERERLMRIGLEIVLGSRAQEVIVRRNPSDTIEVVEDGHSFGFSIDPVLGHDERTVLEHDISCL